MLDESINSGEIPGLVAMIVRNGKVVYHSAKGKADLESGKADPWFYRPDQLAPRLVSFHVPYEGKWIKPTADQGWDSTYPISGSKTHFSGGGWS